jgi:hypothetical protein
MYGLPPFSKRKIQVAGWSAQMYTAFVGEFSPGVVDHPKTYKSGQLPV